MKTQMERVYPILKDVGVQSEEDPRNVAVFLYDDGQAYRAFMCTNVKVNEGIISVHGWNGDIYLMLPSDTPWRLVRRDKLEFVTGAQMEETEIRGLKAKKDLTESLIDEFGLDDKKIRTEYDKGYNPKLYQ